MRNNTQKREKLILKKPVYAVMLLKRKTNFHWTMVCNIIKRNPRITFSNKNKGI